MKKKIRQNKGETIAETMVASLIITMAFLILAGAIVSAARLNAKVKNEDYSLDVKGAGYEPLNGTGSVTITDATGTSYTIPNVPYYKTDKGYVYYE